jgi:hypothetical protein
MNGSDFHLQVPAAPISGVSNKTRECGDVVALLPPLTSQPLIVRGGKG